MGFFSKIDRDIQSKGKQKQYFKMTKHCWSKQASSPNFEDHCLLLDFSIVFQADKLLGGIIFITA